MKLLFLDFDGVFIHAGAAEPQATGVLRELIQTHQPKIVLITMWQTSTDLEPMYQILQRHLQLNRNEVILTPREILTRMNATLDLQMQYESIISRNKRNAVLHYLKSNPTPQNEILILDDFHLDHPAQVVCDPELKWIEQVRTQWLRKIPA